MIDIPTTLFNATQLAAAITKVEQKESPAPSPDLQAKYRWLSCAVRNETQFPVTLGNSFFEGGRYWTAPGNVAAMDLMVFSVCNSDGGVATGVGGGTAFQLVIKDNVKVDIAFGWTNPNWGSYKAGVVQSSNPEDGYNDANGSGDFVETTESYRGKDDHGNEVVIRFHITATPGQYPKYNITQIIV